jgi:hypothetical protein
MLVFVVGVGGGGGDVCVGAAWLVFVSVVASCVCTLLVLLNIGQKAAEVGVIVVVAVGFVILFTIIAGCVIGSLEVTWSGGGKSKCSCSSCRSSPSMSVMVSS